MKNFVKIIDTVSPILKHKIKPKICIECKYYTKDSFLLLVNLVNVHCFQAKNIVAIFW